MADAPLLVALVVAALVVAAVGVLLVALALARLGALARAREASARDVATMLTQLEVLKAQGQDLERDLRQDLAIARGESAQATQTLRGELGERVGQFTSATQQQLAALTHGQGEQLKAFGERLGQFTNATQQALRDAAELQAGQSRQTAERLGELTQRNDQKLEAIRANVEQRLDTLRVENAAKLEQMRATVDEKLQATLEARLGASFKQVSERLEQVHKGLGEMQTLATGVGDLKRVLTNVKSRGTWGEVQLGALLADLLTPAQYSQNVATRPGSKERVEYAVRFPGRGDDGAPCWLPIDAKFPLEDWQRLQEAVERADAVAVDASRRALDAFFKLQAKAIRDKYIESPHTTDFAILFVPAEGLFAEAVSRPGLADALQRDYRVTLAGPTTLSAMLNSLQLGFRTLAIEKRSTEVWRVLGAVKTEFGRFGEILAKTREKLDAVGKTLEDAGRKSTTIARKLRDVEALPEAEADRLLTGDVAGVIDMDVASDDRDGDEIK
ncbi:MAG TPA: DNA recombination protein RmuC [Casimicrobiaceae bacterium]|nr:DNA recombination protein RmuC [Casimicrobiaceae bacterium]